MNVICPECTTTYRVDPAKIPSGGVLAQCARCPATFRVAEATESEVPGPTTESPTPIEATDRGVDDEVVAGVGLDEPPGESDTSVLARGSRFEISLLGGADGADQGVASDAAVNPGESVSSAEQPGSAYTGAADVAFHTDEAPSDDLPYLEGTVAPAGRDADDDTTTEPESNVSEVEPVGREAVAAGPEHHQSAPGETALPPAPFGARSDPHRRAARLARALVSDIVVYHPERRTRSLRQGTLRQEFREEIRKSWEEYANQVGGDFARQTTYFRDALNEILAEGVAVF